MGNNSIPIEVANSDVEKKSSAKITPLGHYMEMREALPDAADWRPLWEGFWVTHRSHSQGIVGEVANCQTSQRCVPSWWVQPLAFLPGLGGKWIMGFELAKTRIFTLKGIFYSWAKANWNTPSLFIQTRTMRSIFKRKWGKGREMAAEVIGYKGQSLKLNIMA